MADDLAALHKLVDLAAEIHVGAATGVSWNAVERLGRLIDASRDVLARLEGLTERLREAERQRDMAINKLDGLGDRLDMLCRRMGVPGPEGHPLEWNLMQRFEEAVLSLLRAAGR